MADHETANCLDCARYKHAFTDWGITGVTGHTSTTTSADVARRTVKVRGEDRLVSEIVGDDEVVEAEPFDDYPHVLAPPSRPLDRHAREREWLREAYVLATHSPDRSTQNGAFLVDNRSWGTVQHYVTRSVNEFPIGVEETVERWHRPTKYAFVEHAERSAIYKAARAGIPTEGLTMVVAWGACADCARAIISAGITRMVCHDLDEDHAHWDESIKNAMVMLGEAGVEVTMVTGRIPGAPMVLRNGKMVRP